MGITIDTVMSYAQALVLGALGWLWKLEGRLSHTESRVTAELANIRLESQQALHALETKLRAALVATDDFRKLEERIERRLDRTEKKLDELLDLMRRMPGAA